MDEQTIMVEPVEDSQLEQEVGMEEVVDVAATPVEPTPAIYTQEEIEKLTPTDIELDRVDPKYRPIVENTIRDYKALQADHTRKAQELAELKRTPPQPETYFQDPSENAAFSVYLENPVDYLSALSLDIAKYDSIVPDDGIDEYRTARKWVAYLNGVKDRFLAKRIDITDSRRNEETTNAKLREELGVEAQNIIDYGKTKGFTEKELKSRPVLLEMVKKEYSVANASRTAIKKEVKPPPQKASTPSGEGLADDSGGKVDTSKMSDSEWFAFRQKEKREELKRKHGG